MAQFPGHSDSHFSSSKALLCVRTQLQKGEAHPCGTPLSPALAVKLSLHLGRNERDR